MKTRQLIPSWFLPALRKSILEAGRTIEPYSFVIGLLAFIGHEPE